MQANRKLVIDDTCLVRPERVAAPAPAECPHCGGPADLAQFWSSSPQQPGQRVLKRQLICRTRTKKNRRSEASCAVVVEVVEMESEVVEMELEPVMEQPAMEQTALEQPAAEAPAKAIPGRVPAEVRAQILELHERQVPWGEIAQLTARSLQAVRRVIEGGAEAPELTLVTRSPRAEPADIDTVIDFLAELPEEALEEVLQLARVTRQRANLLNRLKHRLDAPRSF